jgi:translation initiation factor 1
MRLLAGTKFDRPPHCDRCDLPESDCRSSPPENARVPRENWTARVSTEKRKRGKTVTVVRGVSPDPGEQAELLTHLKTLCGAGGTAHEGILEVQGDHTERIRTALKSLGYRVSG